MLAQHRIDQFVQPGRCRRRSRNRPLGRRVWRRGDSQRHGHSCIAWRRHPRTAARQTRARLSGSATFGIPGWRSPWPGRSKVPRRRRLPAPRPCIPGPGGPTPRAKRIEGAVGGVKMLINMTANMTTAPRTRKPPYRVSLVRRSDPGCRARSPEQRSTTR